MQELESKIKFYYGEISDAENTIAEAKDHIKSAKKSIRELEKIKAKLTELYV